mmetsp:Transcript_134673/g.430181  ORF Transcript_134673/g.430181 Transcript_134673/m.430181 type:complete len:228 (+) Transcript_134673:359-1042(+)
MPHPPTEHRQKGLCDKLLAVVHEAILTAENEDEEAPAREPADVDDAEHLVQERERGTGRAEEGRRGLLRVRRQAELDHEGLEAHEGVEEAQGKETQEVQPILAAGTAHFLDAVQCGWNQNLGRDVVQTLHGAEAAERGDGVPKEVRPGMPTGRLLLPEDAWDSDEGLAGVENQHPQLQASQDNLGFRGAARRSDRTPNIIRYHRLRFDLVVAAPVNQDLNIGVDDKE